MSSFSVCSYQPANIVLEILNERREFVGFLLLVTQPYQNYLEGGKMQGLFTLLNVKPHLQTMEMLENLLKTNQFARTLL